MQASEAKSILEAALLCAGQPMALRDLLTLLGEGFDKDGLRQLLAELQGDWESRGLALVELASGWTFQTRAVLREHLERLHPEKPQRYSRAAMETLAVIAYRQPVTRGDIEDIRGVVVSAQIMRQLEERGWVESIGQRDAPGRPSLYATTRQFLDDLGLGSLSELPPLDALAPSLQLPEQVSLLVEPSGDEVPVEAPQAEAEGLTEVAVEMASEAPSDEPASLEETLAPPSDADPLPDLEASPS